MRLLDLFCGAGGAGMGYSRAGFEVVGCDIAKQRHYPFEFYQGDALTLLRSIGHEFDAIHASPPCQAYTSLRALQKGKQYPDLVAPTREALIASGKPYVIENVPGAPLGNGGDLLVLCGTMFGLVTPDGRAEIRRHRLFECSFDIGLRPACQHGGSTSLGIYGTGSPMVGRSVLCAVGDHPHSAGERHKARREAITVTGHSTHGATYTRAQKARSLAERCAHCGHTMHGHGTDPDLLANGDRDTDCHVPMAGGRCSCAAFVRARRRQAMSVTGATPQTNLKRNAVRETFSVDDARAAMGIDWMPMKSLSQAIPPAYTHWIGKRLMAEVAARRAA